MTHRHVAVCILTYRRPQGLADAVASVARQRLPEATQLSVIVVDNNPAATAEATLARAGIPRPANLIVVHEPTPGVAAARNRALDAAAEHGADDVAFLDDDDVAEPDWLAALLATRTRFGADVVAGPALPAFTHTPPAWVTRGGYFTPRDRPEGTPLDGAATHNVLIARDVLRRTEVRFDTRLHTAGGEDTVFFAELHAHGARMVWSAHARVHETIPPHRTTARWLWRRWLTYGRSELLRREKVGAHGARRGRFAWTGLRRAGYGLVLTLVVLPAWPFGGKGLVIKRTKALCRGISMLAALARVDPGEDKRRTPPGA